MFDKDKYLIKEYNFFYQKGLIESDRYQLISCCWMAKDHSSRMALVLIVLALTAKVCSTAADLHKFDGVLQKYFKASKPSSYYVSIEPKQDGLSKIVNNQIFHEWFGLRVSPNYEDFALEKITSVQIQHAAFVISNKSQEIFKLGSGKNEQAITITLVDLCKKYFLARPTFLAIEDGELTLSAIDSPFWEDAECAPEVLLLRDSSEVQKYFAAKKWERKQNIDGFALYLHPSFAAAYSSASTAGTEGQTAAGSDRQALSEVLRLIRKTHPFEAGKSDEELLSVFDINAKLVSIPDIVERASFTRRSKYLLLRGYSAETNVVILDRTPQQYRLESLSLGEFTIQNITLLGNVTSPFSYILIPHYPGESAKIFEQQMRSLRCVKYHVDEVVYVSIRGDVGSVDTLVKKDSYSEQAPQRRHKQQGVPGQRPAKIQTPLPPLPPPAQTPQVKPKVQEHQKMPQVAGQPTKEINKEINKDISKEIISAEVSKQVSKQVGKEAINKETINKETINKESINKDSINKEISNKEISKETIQEISKEIIQLNIKEKSQQNRKQNTQKNNEQVSYKQQQKQGQGSYKKLFILIFLIIFGIALVFFITRRLLIKHSQRKYLKQKSKITKVDAIFEQITLSESDQSIEIVELPS